MSDIAGQLVAPDAKRWDTLRTPSPVPAIPKGIAADAYVSLSASPSRPVIGDPPTSLSKNDEEFLIGRGDQLLRLGDITSARLFYERAAVAGSGRAATAVGKTHDPLFLLQERSLRSVKPDLASARDWYRRASEAGDPEAIKRLETLETNQLH
jgi:TPR repeat protein